MAYTKKGQGVVELFYDQSQHTDPVDQSHILHCLLCLVSLLSPSFWKVNVFWTFKHENLF